MTMLTDPTAFAGAAHRHSRRVRALFAVQLVDRLTGKPHRIGDVPVAILTQQPDAAATELMRNRDATRWTVRAEPVEREFA